MAMTHIQGEGKLLRIFIGESDRYRGQLLHEAIVRRAREMGLAGATVLRGVVGYGADSVIHTTRLLRLSEDLPIVIEVVEMRDRIDALVTEVEGMLDEADCGGLITLERAEVIRYTPDRRARSRA
jgi:PII-like signaling protein